MHINSVKMNKNIILSLLVFILIMGISCKKDSVEDTTEPFDHEAQLQKDKDSISKYLKTHYFNTKDSIFWTIGSGSEATGALPEGEQLALNLDPNLDSIIGIDVEANETVSSYTMYYYEIAQGIDPGNVGFSSPSIVDSVFVKYTGTLLDSTVFDSREDYPVWFMLPNTIEGWARGMSKFSRGTFETLSDDDFKFIDPGKGYLIFPSGLGYRNNFVGGISDSQNSCLVFRIELDDVKLIDTDLDGVPTKYEITIDEGGNFSFYDTDGDGFNDHSDVDDDNDFSLTRDELDAEFALDSRGNYDFPYLVDEETGETNKIIKGITEDIPDYKDPDRNLED